MKTQAWILAGVALGIVGCSSGGGGSSGSGPGIGSGPSSEPQVVSTTVQVTPLPASYSPGLTNGTYETVALQTRGSGSNRILEPIVEPGAVQIQVDAASKTYTLLMDIPAVPATILTPWTNPHYGTHVMETYRWSDGRVSSVGGDQTYFNHSGEFRATEAPYAEHEILDYYLGNGVTPSNVAIGKLTSNRVKAVTTGQQVSYHFDQLLSEIYFVHGFRTASTDLPVSGSATYIVSSPLLGSASNGEGFFNGDILFTADFGEGTIAANINGEPYNDGEYSAWGVKASGSADYAANGGFAIPIAGTVTTNYEPVVVDQPIAGSIQGAFFGPQAQQLGGVFEFATPDNSVNAAGAFIGGRLSE